MCKVVTLQWETMTAEVVCHVTTYFECRVILSFNIKTQKKRGTKVTAHFSGGRRRRVCHITKEVTMCHVTVICLRLPTSCILLLMIIMSHYVLLHHHHIERSKNKSPRPPPHYELNWCAFIRYPMRKWSISWWIYQLQIRRDQYGVSKMHGRSLSSQGTNW